MICTIVLTTAKTAEDLPFHHLLLWTLVHNSERLFSIPPKARLAHKSRTPLDEMARFSYLRRCVETPSTFAVDERPFISTLYVLQGVNLGNKYIAQGAKLIGERALNIHNGSTPRGVSNNGKRPYSGDANTLLTAHPFPQSRAKTPNTAPYIRPF